MAKSGNRRGAAFAAALSAVAALAGCSSSETPELMNLRSSTAGPDEFGILPPKALEMPTDIANLPAPTPGGGNLTDQNPRGDAILALGGRINAPDGAVPAADQGLLRYVARFGVLGGVREVTAAEDLDWRKRNKGRPLEQLFNVNVYFDAYRVMALDQQSELERWRLRGVGTPSAPPRRIGE
jgi:hypothetical protein